MQHREPSPDENSTIQPAEFRFGRDPAGEAGAQESGKRRPADSPVAKGSSQRPLIAVGALLFIGVVGVFWLLPQMVEKPAPKFQTIPAAGSGEQPSARSPVKASPYSDAEIAQQRRSVQKVLQDILSLQEELQERDVETWAAEEFSAAKSLAEEADGIYRQRQFKRALDRYRESLAAFQQLRDSIPERIETHIAAGNEALDNGDAEAAHVAFDLVLTISEGHPRGVRGKARAEKLPEAWKHFTDGKRAFADGDLDRARDALSQSLEVDPETRAAKELQPEVLAAINARDYSRAMSDGYTAIAERDFSAAEKAFLRAGKLKPEAEDPEIGLQQARNGAEQSSIDRLFARARQQEQSEQWHGAVETYSTLLEKDGSLVSAITGKARADARAKLDDRLKELLDDPLSLGGSKRNQYARSVLADARKISDSGAEIERLQQQVDALETALTQALIPVPVVLQSDSSTSVTIHHVGRLGNFAEREITLKPGHYTAVGTRAGYRDVRREFTVAPGEEPPTIVIQCAEKINGANNS